MFRMSAFLEVLLCETAQISTYLEDPGIPNIQSWLMWRFTRIKNSSNGNQSKKITSEIDFLPGPLFKHVFTANGNLIKPEELTLISWSLDFQTTGGGSQFMGILKGRHYPLYRIYIYIYNLVFVPTISTDGHQKHYTLRIMGSQS